ncbi:hypothetical protein MKW98_025864, partial [Papaver atlanticum]
GLFEFYALRILCDRVEVPAVVVFPPPPQPERVISVLQTFRVDARNVADGDCLTVYVDVADTREASNVPKVVQIAISERLKARAFKDYAKADALYQKIVDAGYRLLRGANNVDILAKKIPDSIEVKTISCLIWGIDAPKKKMHYGQEAKEELTNLVKGKCLTISEAMLKKGCAWHNASFDNRPELTKLLRSDCGHYQILRSHWQKNNPEMPWDWRIPIITKRTL